MRSYVLRLVDSSLRAGRIAGHVEAVQTGRVHAVRDAEELLSVLLSADNFDERSEDDDRSEDDHRLR